MIRGLTGFMAASAKRSLRALLLPSSPDRRFHIVGRKLPKWSIPGIGRPLRAFA